ncbi:transcriptional regulator, MerR family [Desulfovibrio sp. X2]|nr:transcriptional regulator, MerR family [Desulfovibrio sp. X2]
MAPDEKNIYPPETDAPAPARRVLLSESRQLLIPGMEGRDKAKTYKIGQAAKLLEVKPYVLRFWETEFEQIKPVRTPSGQRAYTEETIEVVRRIKHLLWDKGLTIEGARKALEDDQRSGLLLEIESELRDIKTRLEEL